MPWQQVTSRSAGERATTGFIFYPLSPMFGPGRGGVGARRAVPASPLRVERG